MYPSRPYKTSSKTLQTHWTTGFAEYLPGDYGDGQATFEMLTLLVVFAVVVLFRPVFISSMVLLFLGIVKSNLLPHFILAELS